MRVLMLMAVLASQAAPTELKIGVATLKILPPGTPVQVGDLEFSVPEQLYLINQRPDGFVQLDSFADSDTNGQMPANGMEIVALPAEDMHGPIRADVPDRLKAPPIQGWPVLRMVQEQDAGSAKMTMTSIYIYAGPTVYKLYISMHADAPNRRALEASFAKLLDSVRFSK